MMRARLGDLACVLALLALTTLLHQFWLGGGAGLQFHALLVALAAGVGLLAT